MFSRTGSKALKKDLSRTIALCKFLGHPERKFKSVHIAGTNGKGSVCHMLSAIFQENGFKTGLFTSPHLHDFRERIKINGQLVPQSFVVDFVEKTLGYTADFKPSFFELTFGMTMAYFAAEQVDIAVIETGLGGRLDSTNVILPELSVITNIGYDHMDILGNTLDKIAGEKAGIIKEGIPVVIGETHPETEQVFISTAVKRNAPICFADQQFTVIKSELRKDFLEVTVDEVRKNEPETYSIDLTGRYQLKNLLTVLQSVQLLKKKFSFDSNKIKQALSHVVSLTGFEGRWQILRQRPYIVMDVGHNVDGVRQVMEQLKHLNYRQLHIVTGMVKDKDIGSVLSLWPAEARYYFTNAHIARAMPAQQLKEKAAAKGLYGEAWDDVNEAIEKACAEAGEDDLILISGSVFVVGEVDIERWGKKH